MRITFAKKSFIAFMAIVFAASLSAMPFAFAGADNEPMDAQFKELQVPETDKEPAAENAANSSQGVGDCTVTLEYWENVNYDDPDNPPDSNGRRLLGTRVLTGLHEGDVLDTWDYVVDIPGHFFWDAWPATLTVSADPTQNVISLFYFKLWNNQYTVNYYVMSGADLTADNWTDALKPDTVEFTKIASDTFTNQRYDELIEGDAYEYQVNGMYVIDTYPAEIRVGTDPDNNVLNVLYVPDAEHLPDDAPMPDDTVVDKDDLITLLPDDKPVPNVVTDDFTGGNDGSNGNMNITDEMLANPIKPQQAAAVKAAYLESLSMPQTGDNTPMVAAATVAIMALAIAFMALVFGRKSREQQ